MTQEALKELLEAVEEAIQAGDWKVDGACDPDLAIRRAKQALAQEQEPFGYFKAEPFGWTDCAETDEGAVALYTTPPQRPRVVFPTMLRKMWSGSEVQAWLDENVNKEKNT